MSPVVRRITYAVSYEIIAIIFVTIALSSLGHAGDSAGLVAVASSAVALIWNFTFNTLFEKWEMRQASKKRTLRRRVAHAIGFEGGLVVFLVPVIALILGVSIYEAFILEIGLLIFFLVYTFVFAWVFDLIFPLQRDAVKLEDTDASGSSESPEAEAEASSR
ncbi:PACE efflux transporter [Corynebacterium sputi]|uniref:PACE efflux transporter n=1 Tax=Corynebacterium sputi TaxID=489915 RepID=UPI00041F2C49|nr:PACE efflux transporter [Corynebacterium sputi]